MQLLPQLVIFNRVGPHTCCKPCKLILTIVYDAGLGGYTLSLLCGREREKRVEGAHPKPCVVGRLLRRYHLTTLALSLFYLHHYLREKCQPLVLFSSIETWCIIINFVWNKFLEMRFRNILSIILEIDIWIIIYCSMFFSFFFFEVSNAICVNLLVVSAVSDTVMIPRIMSIKI